MRISQIKGIGEKTEKIFHKAGVATVDDLLKYYPRNYDIYEKPVNISELECDRVMAVEGIIAKNIEVRYVRKLQIVTTFIRDEDDMLIKATWFNAAYLKNTLKLGSRFVFRGIVYAKNGAFILEQPKIFKVDEYAKKIDELQPIYPLVSGLTNNMIRKAVKQAIDVKAKSESAIPDGQIIETKDFLPSAIKQHYGLCDHDYAVKNIHFPNKKDEMFIARKRLIFDEFFAFVYTLRKFKEDTNESSNEHVMSPDEKIEKVIEALPYKLTNAQLKTWEEIKTDMAGNKTMNRLIQGDVGSGKTIVAILALFTTALSGSQGAIMVPTEVLARQHFENISSMIEESQLDIKAVLLTGSMTVKEKRIAYEKIANQEAQIIVGTHAIFQDNVIYKDLALVVTDEQHRFGVRQREAISKKGNNPHVIVMSATPIPRTLAIIMYGDLDISVIDELPANRLPIKNCVVGNEYRPNAYKFMENQVREGRQIYVICPTVEYSEAVEGENVVDYAEKLKRILPPSVQIQYLHGKMKSSEKNEIMENFARNEIQILVSTTVVEVGVNVPNATVMMIENAERFGLAGLHQLRGRVGRGGYQSYCIFVNGSGKKEASKRLDILLKSNDGFEIASEDLKLRGPGDFFGVRQSGDMEFRLGDIYTDTKVIKQVSEAITKLDNGEFNITEEEVKELDKAMFAYTKVDDTGINL